jgi:hypothetical protein
MAKISFSALVSKMSGKNNGQTHSTWKGINILKATPNPRQPHSEKQQLLRGIVNDLAGEFYALTATQKEMWNRFASQLPNPMTGLNAYVKLNSNLIRYRGSSYKITAPPPTPSTPDAITGFAATNTDSVTATLAWTAPSTVSDYVVIDRDFMAGRDNSAKPRWSFAAGASASLTTQTYTHDYPIGTVLKFQAFVMDSYGRCSPSTDVKTITVA